MTGRVVDLDLRRSLRRDAERLAAEHPELTEGAAPERLAAALEADEPDLTDEPSPGSERRRERPASRADRDP